MIMSLGAIGLNTNFKEVSKRFLPMVHGFLISALVVVVSFGVLKINGTNLDQLSGLFSLISLVIKNTKNTMILFNFMI